MQSALYQANFISSQMTPDFARVQPVSFFANSVSTSNVISVDFKRRGKPTVPDLECDSWQKVAAERLDGLREYNPGWDGPASRAISEDVLARAGKLLTLAFQDIPYPAPPAAVPCADGSVQLEWWLVDSKFELTIKTDGSTEAWGHILSTNEECEAMGKDATNLFLQWARRLTADRLVAVA